MMSKVLDATEAFLDRATESETDVSVPTAARQGRVEDKAGPELHQVQLGEHNPPPAEPDAAHFSPGPQRMIEGEKRTAPP
jgi:hypothetical protein